MIATAKHDENEPGRKLGFGISLGVAGADASRGGSANAVLSLNSGLKSSLGLTLAAEQAGVDFIAVADHLSVEAPAVLPGESGIQNSRKLDAALAAAALAAVTSSIGLVATVSPAFIHPFVFCRRMASIERISKGRLGWLLPMENGADEAANFGLPAPKNRLDFLEETSEFLEVTKALFDSWEAAAFLRNKETGIYIDRSKVHFLNHDGLHFKIRGPLDVDRPLQGHLPLFTSGDFRETPELIGKYSDIHIGQACSADEADIEARELSAVAESEGRRVSQIIHMQNIQCFIGETLAEAEDAYARREAFLDPNHAMAGLFEEGLQGLPQMPGDAPLHGLSLTGVLTDAPAASRQLLAWAGKEGLSLQELLDLRKPRSRSVEVIGTIGDVCDRLEHWFLNRLADGFVAAASNTQRDMARIISDVVPELRRRGLTRLRNGGATLRETLGLPVISNRYA